MAELIPYPFEALARRMFRELRESGSIFDLPKSRFYSGRGDLDMSVDMHGRRAGSPLGPAAGPQTQMAQNIVLSWLGGSRVLELKTVQILDELEIPRPCIDMRTVGLNAEWSQELRLQESLLEYAKGAFLIAMLRESDEVEMAPGFAEAFFDTSVGYDLAGISSPSVHGFIESMKNATVEIESLRSQVPKELAHLRDVSIDPQLSNTVTLSTFHGCPPTEIESIVEHLMREHGVHCVVKFNPTLLGVERVRHILHDVLGYRHLTVPDSAFENDIRWENAIEMMERLGVIADSLGLGLGAKFTNTLIVENDGAFLPASAKEVYLSGQPLHVLAIALVDQFRKHFGTRFDVSFSAGIDQENVADAVALDLLPVTACTDLLRTGGYGRQTAWYRQLEKAMDACNASSREDFVLTAFNGVSEVLGLPADQNTRQALGDEAYERAREKIVVHNTSVYAARVLADPRYRYESNARPPKKIGSHLEFFDCITCDKCVPVCPNHANFLLAGDTSSVPVIKLHSATKGTWRAESGEPILLQKKHQIANISDFCNECGNCDVFCPEDGGPYVVKPRFFVGESAWRAAKALDGFHVWREGETDRVLGRFEGKEYEWVVDATGSRYRSEDFDLYLPDHDSSRVVGKGPEVVDLTFGLIMDWLRRALLDCESVNYINVLASSNAGTPLDREKR